MKTTLRFAPPLLVASLCLLSAFAAAPAKVHDTAPVAHILLEVDGKIALLEKALATDETFTIPADPTPGYSGRRGVHLIRDWVESARTGRNVCRNTVDSTLAALRLLDLVYRSSKEGRMVECDVRPAKVPVWTSPT